MVAKTTPLLPSSEHLHYHPFHQLNGLTQLSPAGITIAASRCVNKSKEGWKMKSQKTVWTTILLLVGLGIGGCLVEATQEEGPTTGQSSQQSQAQETQK
jgi:hypothetical protein